MVGSILQRVFLEGVVMADGRREEVGGGRGGRGAVRGGAGAAVLHCHQWSCLQQ